MPIDPRESNFGARSLRIGTYTNLRSLSPIFRPDSYVQGVSKISPKIEKRDFSVC